jgi:enamine deaminase RidA (YjgF/YER057c/UK114 family)
MIQYRNAPTIAAPAGRYSHAVEVRHPANFLHISGQVGFRPDGSLPADFAGQADQSWRNISAILADAGMTMNDLVKITVFLTRPEDIAEFRSIRDRHLGSAIPASSLLIVSRLVIPELLVEVEAVAARAA